jgi:hypothetical protein
VWGALHGIYLVIANLWRDLRTARGWRLDHWSYRGASVVLTFVAVLFAWVFFRANSLAAAGSVIASMLGAQSEALPIPDGFYRSGRPIMLLLLLVAWAMPNTQQLLRSHDPTIEPVERMSRWQLHFNVRNGLILGGLFFGVLASYFVAKQSPFIYFNF